MPHSIRTRQCGVGTLEFTLAALPLLAMGMLVIETAHWHQQRLLLRHALHESARAGSTAAASPAAIRTAFLSSLPTPLRQRMIASTTQWQLRVLSPSADSHADFDQPDPAQAYTPVIRHDYQLEQHRTRLAQGWPDGRGPHSGQTIFEANTLHLTLDYPHRPWLPGLPSMPIRIKAQTGMQSHARHWSGQDMASPTNQDTPALPAAVPTHRPDTATHPAQPAADATRVTISPPATVKADVITHIETNDESLCGIALCCGAQKNAM